MARIIVAGGTGFFGGALLERLSAEGLQPLQAARHGPVDLRLDVEDPASLREALQPGDVLLDAVGPFQGRSTALAEAAIQIGFDLIDLSDSLEYCQRLVQLEPRIAARGIRVLTACSSISVGSAALVRLSGIEAPTEAHGFLVPAARHVAWPGTGASLLNSVGAPIRVWREGRLQTIRGWSETRSAELPEPLGPRTGYLFESADALLLPRIWPGLRSVDFYVSSNVPGFDAMFRMAARSGWVRRTIARLSPIGLWLARRIGGSTGCLTYQIVDAAGRQARLAFVGPDRSYLTPVAPMVLAAKAIAAGRFEPRGLVPADQQVAPEQLVTYLATLGVQLIRIGQLPDRSRSA